MSIPDFRRAEYDQPQVVEGEVVGSSMRRGGDAFPLALLYGMAAAIAGSIGYSLVASLGFMISIVAIGIAWLIAKAMMTASRGVGGREYQVAAVVLTYLAVSSGELLGEFWRAHQRGVPLGALVGPFMRYVLVVPFLELRSGLNGIIGAVILAIGLRAAWRMAAGGPGFTRAGGSATRMGPFGPR